MEAKEALKIYLGGNMNTCSLKPLAIIEIMKSYAEMKCRERDEAISKVWKILESDIPKPKFILALLEIKRLLKPLVTNN